MLRHALNSPRSHTTPLGPSKLARLPERPSVYATTVNDEEVALFDSRLSTVAYTSPDDGLTVYMWGGAPVANLMVGRADTRLVFGFDRRYLGWLENGRV